MQGVEHVSSHKKRTHKRFYQQFQLAYNAFTHTIQGITEENEVQTYAALMLRRVMVLFFLQHKGLLDYDKSYLSNRLSLLQNTYGKDYFYRYLLIPLFHNFLSRSVHQSDPTPLIGNVPALALPLFQMYPLEHYAPHIQIPDDAFTQLFAFLDGYQWKLEKQTEDEAFNTLYPEILEDIFAQQINQKQIGAYYTQSDVATYLVKNTLLPYLLHTVARQYPEEFAPTSNIWHLLRKRPERYIPSALQSKAHLPKETKQEYAVRQTRYHDLSAQLRAGEIQAIDEFITHNLNIGRFVQDWITHCEKPELLVTFYKEMEQMSILDPTCGSGAFLCAAVSTLEALYTDCLQSLQSITDTDTHLSQLHTPLNGDFDEKGSHDYTAILKKVQAHPTRRHFVLNTILNNNLYGVEIMEEVTELCRLRLFLMLTACSERIEDTQSFSSIKWNIVTGNALADPFPSLKAHRMLDSTLYTRGIGEIDASPDALNQVPTEGHYQQKRDFHWCKTFPHVMEHDGFDVIIGNPPYVEYSKVRQNYQTQGSENWGNLYAAILERSLALCRSGKSYLGLIVPLSICSGERFAQLRNIMTEQSDRLWLANFEIFPSRLFEGAFQRLSIVIAQHSFPTTQCTIYTTRIQRWYASERPYLIGLLRYVPTQRTVKAGMFPKLASPLQETILQKLVEKAQGKSIEAMLSTGKTQHFVYYQEATNYWMKATCRVPYYKKNGEVLVPMHGRFLYCANERMARLLMALLNSSLFYLWFATFSDGFHLSHALVKEFPLGTDLAATEELVRLALQLEEDIQLHARLSTRNTKAHLIELEEYRMSLSKSLLDKIDMLLGAYYGLNTEELEFVLNYDGKYRMGREK